MMWNRHELGRKDEGGMALVATLLFLMTMGVLSAALVFTVQNDMRTSGSYKYSQQAFYAANAGIQRAAHWYANSYSPHVPTTDYDTTTLPIRYSGSDVRLAGQAGSTSVYPDSSVTAAFTAGFSNQSLQADEKNTGVYALNATLLKHLPANFINPSTFVPYASAIERWRINSIGYWGTTAKPLGVAQITAIVENSGNALFDRALWGIDYLQLGGNVLIDSYNPALGDYGGTNIGNNGAIGSNGYITANGNVEVKGDVAFYDDENTSIGSNCTVAGDMINMQEPREFPPIPDFEVGTTDINMNSKGTTTISPGSYGTVSIKKGTLQLEPGVYYFDSLSDSANGALAITGETTIFVRSSLDLGGSGVMNPMGDPTKLTIYYAGTSEAKIHGNPESFLEVYAPNAPLKFVGTSDFFGSFIGKSATVQGTPEIHFSESSLNQHLIQRPFRIINWSQDTF